MINNNLTSAGRAKLLRQQRQNNIEEAKRIEEEQKVIQKKNNASIWEKIGDTLWDFGANFVGGASKAIEGVIDTGSALAGNVAGWFGADDFKQQMQENIAYNWTGNNITNPVNEKTDASLLNDSKFGQYVEGMASGIGQLLPTVAVSFIPGGAGLSKVMLFGSAMGNSTEQAVNEGADLSKSTIYGALSGGVELVSERISGKLFGAGKIDRALGFKENLERSLFKSAKSGVWRMAQEAVGEGLEEAFAEAVNPILKKWTYDPDAKGATFSEIWDSAVVGALTSIAFGGTVGQLPTYKNASRVSRIQDQVNEYNDAVDKLYQDSTNGKLNAEERQSRQDELAKRKVIIEENISSIMQEFDKGWNITQKSRQAGKQEALKRINASGNLKMGLNSEGKLVDIQDKDNPNNSPYNVLASSEMANKVAQTKDFMKDANIEAVSSNLSGQEHLIQYKPTSNPLTTEMKTALKTFADFSKAKGQNQKFVVVDKNDSQFKGARGLIVDDTGVIYLREDLSANDVINNIAQVTAVHEFSHGLEKTGAYQELTRFVFNNLAKDAELAKQFGIENFEADYKKIATLYATNENTRNAFNRKSAKEQREYIQSEYMAKFLSEKAFTDSKSIKSLCRTNQSLGQKILNWLKDFVDRLNSVNKVERQMKVFLQKARNLYSTAIQQSGNIETRKNIAYALNEQNLDKDSDVKYSNDDEIVLSKKEYSILKSEVVKKNALQKNKNIKKVNCAYTRDYYYIYSTKGYDNFKPLLQLEIESNYELINEIERRLKYGFNENTGTFDEWVANLQSGEGFDNGSDVSSTERRTNDGIDENNGRESINDRRRDTIKNSRNQQKKIKLSLEDSISTQYGEGYSIDDINTKDYNLVDVQDKKQFKNLLSNLVRQIKSGVEMKTSANMNLRHGLFNCLQNQKNNVYSKLAEINTAYEKTVSAYNKNNAINIPQTFIQALGYNGAVDGKNSVIYDLNNKKKNLLDYSEDRATERLDKAIKLFGETKDPSKAGWLLSDGRFVDYNRDSSNILSGNVLDYQDHWQIEKVFDTRRGTDAIDAFMAEGNIRLMPEAGGIELRGKPNKNQIDKLEQFIDAVIDKEGITLDLRPAGTNENYKPNPVFYDNTASVKEVMQGINSYYNTGKVAKVVDGMKFSLDEDSQGNKLTKAQQEFFKDSKVRDDNGNLLVVYHGTNSEFYEFDKSKIKIDNLGKGFYFVDNKEIADSYALRRTEERGGKERVVSGYIDSIKPFDISNISDEEIKSYLVYDYLNRKRPRYEYRKKHGDEIIDAEQYATDLMNDEDIPINENGTKDYSVLFSTKEENFQKWLHENKYDCLIVEGEDSRTKIQGVAYVIFDSNKFKLTTNHNPTLSDDIRYSLDDNVDNTQSDNVEYKKIEGLDANKVPLKLQNAIVEYAQRWERNHKKFVNESIAEWEEKLKKEKSTTNIPMKLKIINERLEKLYAEQNKFKKEYKILHNSNGEWILGDFKREGISRLSQKDGSKEINGSKETVSFLEYLITHNKFYKDYSGKNSIEGYSMKVVDKKVLPYEFHQIIDENKTMGIRTFFIVDDVFYKTSDEPQTLMGMCMDDRVFIKLSYNHPDYIEVNKHERLHYIKMYHKDIYNNFKIKLLESLTVKEKVDLYDKYYEIYEDVYDLTLDDLSSKENERVWEEVFAQIYAEAEVPSNYRKIGRIIGEFDDTIKQKFGLEKDIQFSLDDDFDISDYYIPSDDGFFNAKNIKGQTRDTDAIKYRAKLKQDKVFSKEELSKVISDALNQTQNMRLSGKVKDIAIGELFERMNTQDVYEKRKTAQDIANFIINNAFYDEIYTETYEQQVAEFELIDSYKGHFKLNEQIKQELEYKTENGARIVNAWSEKGYNVLADGTKKNKAGVNPFDVAEDLISQGLMIDTDKSETEIFMDIYERYNALDELIKEFRKSQKELAKDKLDSVTMRDNKQALVDTILKAYNEKGSKTASAKLKELYHENMSKIKKQLKDEKKNANAHINYLIANQKAKKLTSVNKHYSAGVLENKELKTFLKEIAKTGNFKTIKKTAREQIQKLAEVYNTSKKGSLFNDILGQEQEMTKIFGVKDSVYDENIANMIQTIADGSGELTTDEIILLTKITDGLIHLYNTYDKVFKNGKYIETEKLAKDYSEKMRVGIDVRNKAKFLKGMWRFRAMFDPHTVMRNLDGYRCEYNSELGIIEDRGFFTEMFQDITDGEVKANVAELELLKPFGDFFKANKKFERSLTKDKIKLNGTQIKTNGVKVKTEVEISVGEAISIYLTSLRPQSNFYDSSVILQNKDKTTSEYAFDVKQINELFGKFTEAQKQYIKLVQKFFNEDAQKLKVETDLATLGYTNIEDSGVYFPINRDRFSTAKNLGDAQMILDAINTFTLSFNKDVKPGAKLPIKISNVHYVVQNHAKGIGAYYGLSVPLKTFNRVFNKQIESMGKQSLKRIAGSQLPDSVKYIDDLLKDIQGRENKDSKFANIIRWMRGNYAKFQLGFNPKTVLGQTSSYMMASTYLDIDALAKGLTMKTNTEQMFKYAPFTKYRMQEKAIVKAQGVINKVGTWTDTFTKGIEWMDNNVVKKLWNASQVQVEKNTGHKIGTEENLNRASKLLERVVRETQSNSIDSEKTSLARDKSEIVQSLTMFTSDAQKQASRLVDGLAMLSATKQWIANGTLKADDKIAKVAKKQIFRAGAGFVTATTMYVLIGMMMKHLLGKNDEEETITEEFFGDFKSQMAGLIPIYREIYGYFNDGYELNNYAYAMVNDTLSGTKAGKKLIEDLLSGKQLSKSEIGMPLRKSIYAVAQLFGVPVRNVWNYGYGIVNQFSPSTAYRMNSLFYDAKLTDLDKSIESGNDRKSISVIKELFESKNLDIDNNYAQEVLGLYKEGFNVIPSEIKESFSYNGEELTLTSAQHKQLLNAMNDVLAGFNDVVKQAEYKKLSATQKRTYLNNLYDINYILNLAQVIGLDNMKDSDIKKCLFANVLGSDLISYMAYIKTFESDKDKEGNTVTNSKKTKIQNWVKRLKLTPAEKYLLMGFAGYKNINGESAVNVYLRRKGLSKDERELVLKWCGY